MSSGVKEKDEYKEIRKKERQKKMKKEIKNIFIWLVGVWIFITCWLGSAVVFKHLHSGGDVTAIALFAALGACGYFLSYIAQK